MELWLTDIILTLLFGTLVKFNVFFLLLLPSGVGTADHLPSSHPPLASSSVTPTLASSLVHGPLLWMLVKFNLSAHYYNNI